LLGEGEVTKGVQRELLLGVNQLPVVLVVEGRRAAVVVTGVELAVMRRRARPQVATGSWR